MRIAIDTNILVYASGLNDSARRDAAVDVLRRLPQDELFIPVQAMGELFHVLVIKSAVQVAHAKNVLLRWRNQYSLIETSEGILVAAIDLASEHHLRIWDAIIVAAAGSAECRILLSEDLQDGFTWNGVSVVNPFAEKPNPLLADLLDS